MDVFTNLFKITNNVEVTKKVCTKCNKELPITNFSKSSGANFLRPECRACNNKLAKVRKQLNETYGKPPQGYTCPICKREANEVINKGGSAGAWVVDHCHTTDKFRGWLCHSCNRLLGICNDDISNLKRAIKYLKNSQIH